MASLATVAGSIATAIAGLTSSPTRVGSDRAMNLEGLAAGATKYQLRADHETEIETADSNLTYQGATITVAMHHELASASDERAYTQGNMLVDQESLMSRAWWRAIAGIYDVYQGPTIQSEAARVGNTISYSMAVSISITG
jgi:hypothetical protein